MVVNMDTSYLSQQVNTIIGQLHGLFDEIGVPSHDRENREAEVGSASPRMPRALGQTRPVLSPMEPMN